MTDLDATHENPDPTDGHESNNLQIETEEKTQEETTESTQRVDDQSFWYPNNSASENSSDDNEKQESTDKGKKSKKRYAKKNNTRLANLRNTKSLKKRKLVRLYSERDAKKAVKTRGYLVVSLDNNSEDSNTKHTKQVKLDAVDKEVLSSGITDLDVDIYALEEEVKKVNDQILSLATVKRSTSKDKLIKMKGNRKVDDLVARIDRELTKAAKSGNAQIISEIRLQAQTGNTSEAYNSIKSFLSEKVKTVSKKLEKSTELQDNVLNRVIEKLSKVNS